MRRFSFSRLRDAMVACLALAVALSGIAASSMAVEHMMGAEASAAAPTHVADHDGCAPEPGETDTLCCGHPACTFAYSLATPPSAQAPAPVARAVLAPVSVGSDSGRNFPALDPPRL